MREERSASEILDESLKMDEEFGESNPVISHKDLCGRYKLI